MTAPPPVSLSELRDVAVRAAGGGGYAGVPGEWLLLLVRAVEAALRLDLPPRGLSLSEWSELLFEFQEALRPFRGSE